MIRDASTFTWRHCNGHFVLNPCPWGLRCKFRSNGSRNSLLSTGQQVINPTNADQFRLTHWGRVTQICVSKFTIIGSDNGLSPIRHQVIIWTNVGILLIRTLGTNFSEILIQIHIFSNKKIRLKMSPRKCRPFCLGLTVLTPNAINIPQYICPCCPLFFIVECQNNHTRPSGAETGIFNTMAADAMATGVALAASAIVLTMNGKQFLVFQEEVFPLPVPSKCREMA